MTTSFVRQVGHESNVQLNPLRDTSELPSLNISDQVFGIAARFTRGRIDRAFKVDTSNARSKLGRGEPVRVSALNEPYVHVFEALDQGAYEAVISRLTTSAAKVKWATVTITPAVTGAEPVPESIVFAVSEDEPDPGFTLAVKHLECFNDGIVLSLHADEVVTGGVAQATKIVTLRLSDKDGNVIHEYTGSLDADAKDDYGQPNWLPDVVASQTVDLEVLAPVDGSIAPESAIYGSDANGQANWVSSAVLECFEEGGTAYTTDDYLRARNALQYTPHNYAYISSGGSQSPALLLQLAILAFQTNRQFRYDIPGNLKPEAAIAFAEQLNMGSQKEAHLLHAFWAPLRTNDPTGINGKGYYGTATLNIALACARNAQIDANGFAPKNFPVAGREFPVPRSGVVQTYTPSNPELSALAKAKINVVCWEEYDGGGRYVWRDSVTSALVDNSLRKLIAVADMAAHTDDFVTRTAKAALQKPMKTSVRVLGDALKRYFEGAEAAEWIVPSDDPSMKGAAARYEVAPNKARPYDALDVRYWVRYDGTNRVTYVTQTITR